MTADGGATWTDVTPPALREQPWSKISIMDASHFDAQTAYAAVNTLRLDDMRPHIYRTHDGGKTWTQIVTGIDSGAINVVREDPKRAGCCSPGSDRQVWVSFDDGDHWQSLRLNMPATSIRDLVIKDDDIGVGTHGRSFWILDDITPLRQLADGTGDWGQGRGYWELPLLLPESRVPSRVPTCSDRKQPPNPVQPVPRHPAPA